MSDDKNDAVKIEYTDPINLDDDDISDIAAAAQPHDPAELGEIKRVVIPEDVRQQMVDAGLDPNEVVSLLLRGGKKPS